jgi:hypothetical protein
MLVGAIENLRYYLFLLRKRVTVPQKKYRVLDPFARSLLPVRRTSLFDLFLMRARVRFAERF